MRYQTGRKEKWKMKLTNEEIEAARQELIGLIHAAYGNGWDGVSDDERDRGLKILDALCAEVERLESEAVVMRELCEAAVAETRVMRRYHEQDANSVDLHKAANRKYTALDAYRATKGGKSNGMG